MIRRPGPDRIPDLERGTDGEGMRVLRDGEAVPLRRWIRRKTTEPGRQAIQGGTG